MTMMSSNKFGKTEKIPEAVWAFLAMCFVVGFLVLLSSMPSEVEIMRGGPVQQAATAIAQAKYHAAADAVEREFATTGRSPLTRWTLMVTFASSGDGMIFDGTRISNTTVEGFLTHRACMRAGRRSGGSPTCFEVAQTK